MSKGIFCWSNGETAKKELEIWKDSNEGSFLVDLLINVVKRIKSVSTDF